MNGRRTAGLEWLGPLLLLLGPGSATGLEPTEGRGLPTTMPSAIYVEDFTVDVSQVQLNRGPVEHIEQDGLLRRFRVLHRPLPLIDRFRSPEELADFVVNALADAIVQTLNEARVPARRLAAGVSAPPGSWLLAGEFDRVEEGSIAEHAMVGFGMGSPRIEVSGDLAHADAPDAPFLIFGEAAKRRRLPGAAVKVNPYVIAAKVVLASHATERDVQALGRQIGADVLRFMTNRGILRGRS